MKPLIVWMLKDKDGALRLGCGLFRTQREAKAYLDKLERGIKRQIKPTKIRVLAYHTLEKGRTYPSTIQVDDR